MPNLTNTNILPQIGNENILTFSTFPIYYNSTSPLSISNEVSDQKKAIQRLDKITSCTMNTGWRTNSFLYFYQLGYAHPEGEFVTFSASEKVNQRAHIQNNTRISLEQRNFQEFEEWQKEITQGFQQVARTLITYHEEQNSWNSNQKSNFFTKLLLLPIWEILLHKGFNITSLLESIIKVPGFFASPSPHRTGTGNWNRGSQVPSNWQLYPSIDESNNIYVTSESLYTCIGTVKSCQQEAFRTFCNAIFLEENWVAQTNYVWDPRINAIISNPEVRSAIQHYTVNLNLCPDIKLKLADFIFEFLGFPELKEEETREIINIIKQFETRSCETQHRIDYILDQINNFRENQRNEALLPPSEAAASPSTYTGEAALCPSGDESQIEMPEFYINLNAPNLPEEATSQNVIQLKGTLNPPLQNGFTTVGDFINPFWFLKAGNINYINSTIKPPHNITLAYYLSRVLSTPGVTSPLYMHLNGRSINEAQVTLLETIESCFENIDQAYVDLLHSLTYSPPPGEFNGFFARNWRKLNEQLTGFIYSTNSKTFQSASKAEREVGAKNLLTSFITPILGWSSTRAEALLKLLDVVKNNTEYYEPIDSEVFNTPKTPARRFSESNDFSNSTIISIDQTFATWKFAPNYPEAKYEVNSLGGVEVSQNVYHSASVGGGAYGVGVGFETPIEVEARVRNADESIQGQAMKSFFSNTMESNNFEPQVLYRKGDYRAEILRLDDNFKNAVENYRNVTRRQDWGEDARWLAEVVGFPYSTPEVIQKFMNVTVALTNDPTFTNWLKNSFIPNLRADNFGRRYFSNGNINTESNTIFPLAFYRQVQTLAEQLLAAATGNFKTLSSADSIVIGSNHTNYNRDFEAHEAIVNKDFNGDLTTDRPVKDIFPNLVTTKFPPAFYKKAQEIKNKYDASKKGEKNSNSYHKEANFARRRSKMLRNFTSSNIDIDSPKVNSNVLNNNNSVVEPSQQNNREINNTVSITQNERQDQMPTQNEALLRTNTIKKASSLSGEKKGQIMAYITLLSSGGNPILLTGGLEGGLFILAAATLVGVRKIVNAKLPKKLLPALKSTKKIIKKEDPEATFPTDEMTVEQNEARSSENIELLEQNNNPTLNIREIKIPASSRRRQ